MHFQAASKFGILSAKLILSRVNWFTGFTGKWCQIRKWFLTHIKDITLHIDILQSFSSDFWNNKKIWHCLRQIDIGKSWGWRIYRATTWSRCKIWIWFTTGNWHQIWIWLEGNFKGFMVQIEIPAAISNSISKQQVNLLLFLPDWYYENWEWRIYQAKTGEWRQIRIWFVTYNKGIKLQIETIGAIFQWLLK